MARPASPLESGPHLPDEKEILAQYTPEEQRIIRERQQQLSVLCYFVGKDFDMPVLLNEPGAGWHWNFEENEVRIDPKDLLEKPMDYLRFVICHEAGHRRISRMDQIPQEQWNEPGFPFLMNAIEDPRDNNFVVEAYPRFREPMKIAYELDAEFEARAKKDAKGKLGTEPRYFQAGMEYLKQWVRDANGEPFAVNESLPEDVRAAVEETLSAAQEAWWLYPSKAEADGGEKNIEAYAQASYRIVRERVWPRFKELIEKDIDDQLAEQLLKEMRNGDEELRKSFEGKLTEEEKAELEQALKGEEGTGESRSEERPEPQREGAETSGSQESQPARGEERSGESSEGAGDRGKLSGETAEPAEEGGSESRAIDLDSLSPGLKQKLADEAKALSEERRAQIEEAVRQMIREFERMLNEYLESKLEQAKEQAERGDVRDAEPEGADERPEEPPTPEPEESESRGEKDTELQDAAQRIKSESNNAYERAMHEELGVIRDLEDDLREIFVERRAHAWETGFRSGKKLDIKKRMQEKAKRVSAVESRAWQKREAPLENDYAVKLLVDLSGSMTSHGKIEETFKAVVALAEVLNALSIKTSIVGFHDQLIEYQRFDETLTDEMRARMGSMLQEVYSRNARYNDDGWAVEESSKSLAAQDEAVKLLVVLSDGYPEPSSAHDGSKFELKSVVSRILDTTDQKIIGLGIGPDTEHVEHFYPRSIADVPVEEMAQKLADVLRDAIADPGTFEDTGRKDKDI